MSIAYCESLRNALVKSLEPLSDKTVSVEVFHHHHTLLVNASVDGVVVRVSVPLT